jgi:arginyl-tRNA synthetase
VLTAAPELIPGRVKLAQAVRQVLTDGLNTLTIQVPDVM